MRIRAIAAAASMSAAAVFLSGCGTAQPDAAESEFRTVRVGLANPSCIAFFPIYTAIEEGYFADEGLEVVPSVANGSAAVLQGMIAGQTELGTPAATPLINSHVEGSDIRFIANMSPGGTFALVAPEASGLTDAADLKGAKIGVSTADGGEVAFLKQVMAAAGLSDKDYEIVVAGEAGQAIAGFSRGDIDAYSASVDGVATLEFGGIELTDLSGSDIGHLFGNGLAAGADFIEAEPETIEAFGRAFQKGLKAGLADPELVVETCQQHQPQEVEDPAYVETLLGAIVTVYTPRDGRPFGESVEEYWQRVIDSLVEAGELEEGAVAATDMFTNEFVSSFSE